MPDSMKELAPANRRGLPEIRELALRKLERETKKHIKNLPKEAIPQDVIYSLSELPSILRGRKERVRNGRVDVGAYL